MKKILNYIAVVTAAALLAPSCSTEGVDNIPEGQGLITMNVETGTRAAGDPVALDQCTVGIYDLNQEGALVRKYAKGNCPNQIALVAGRYRVKVQYGQKPDAASFDNCYYEGQSDPITLAAGSTESANVVCLPQSLAVEVRFGDNFAELFNSYAADVTLGSGVTNGSLHYTENRTGYFTLPEDVTEMSWTFTGEHKTEGTITKTATFGVEMGKKYALSFKFSPDLPGYISIDVITIEVGSSIDWDDEFNFSNDPEITSTNSGFFSAPQVYAGEAMTVQVDAQAAITKLSVEVAGKTVDLMNSADGRVTVTLNSSRTGATITLNPSFFDFACGDTAVTFKVEDQGGGQAAKTATIRMEEGIIPVMETDYNLWTNSITLHAKSNGAVPVFKLRAAGQAEWQTVNGTLDGDEYVAVMNPEWISSQNENNLTVYSPKENTGVWAGGSYEAMVEFDGRTSKTSFSTRGGDTIPNGDMEDTGASCYTQSNSSESSVIWGSGNNFMTKKLCQPAQFDGMGGANCSVLTATQTAGNLAAGNLFLGTFTMNGANGTVDFGIRYGWTARPKGLRFKYHATVGTVNINKYDGPLAKNSGVQDQISIYFAIMNWSNRHGVTSGVSAPSGIWSVDAQSNLEGSGPIIAYGTMVIDTSTAGNTMVEGYIPINFYDTSAGIPDAAYTLTIACSTSRYGDYMNGCDKNVLYVDDFEWVY